MAYLEIDTRSPVPIYEQIMDRIRGLVRDGELVPDTPLPPVRQLALDLEINPNTVARAYGLLEREGIVTTAGRRGTIVAATAPDRAERTVDERVVRAVDRVIDEASVLGVSLEEFAEVLRRRWGARVEGGSV